MCQLKNPDHNNKQLLRTYTKLSSRGEKKEREENLNNFRNKWLKTIRFVTQALLMALTEQAPFHWQGRPWPLGRRSCVSGTSLAPQVSQKSLQFGRDILWFFFRRVNFFFRVCKPTLSSLSLQTGKGTPKLGEYSLHEFPQKKGSRSARARSGHYVALENELLKSVDTAWPSVLLASDHDNLHSYII